jgi:hypothetical protein
MRMKKNHEKKKKKEKFHSIFGWKEEVEKGEGVSERGLKEAMRCVIGLKIGRDKIMGKVCISSSNYHSIVNISFKLSIVSMSPLIPTKRQK